MSALLPANGNGSHFELAAVNGRSLKHRDNNSLASGIEQPGDWHRYMSAVFRHKWTVALITLVGTLAGVFAATFLEPRYAARAILWLDVDRRELAQDPLDASRVVEAASWADLVTSVSVLDDVVSRLNLHVRPASNSEGDLLASLSTRENVVPGSYLLKVDESGRSFTLENSEGDVIQTGTPGDSIGRQLGISWAPPAELLPGGRKAEFSIITKYAAAQSLGRALRVRLDPGGSFVKVELRGEDPALTAATVNTIVERVPVVAAELKREKFAELANIFGEQYDHARRALASAEGDLAAFRERNAESMAAWRETAGGAATTRVTPYMDLRLRREGLEQDRSAIMEALSSSGASGLRLEALEAIAAVRESRPLRDALEETAKQRAELRALRFRYTDSTIAVQIAQGKLDSLERRVVPALATQLASELTRRERTITPRLDSARAGLQNVPSMLLGEERLLRRVNSASDLATTVESRYQAAKLGVLSTQPDVRVLDAASTPQQPVSDFAPLIVLLSFMTSLVIAVAGVSVRDKTDPRIRYPEQVTRQMRLPILGAIPHVGRRIPAPGETSAEAIESLRGLRVRVIHALGGTTPFVFTVSSPAPGEGKSFVSANLALSFAYAGYRTILIDGDVRRGAQHHALAIGVTPGLTDVLTGQIPLDSAIIETSYGKLAFLSSGTRMSCAPELLHSPILADSLSRLRALYDVILIDSPPLVAGIDPLVLATATNNLLLVLRSSATELPLAMAKLEVADSLPIRVIGAVLNDVRARGPFKHYGYELTEYQELEDPMTSVRRDSWRNVLSGRSG